MKTEVVVVGADQPDPKVIARTADVLRGGGLVAFPTETVYGLGANALDEGAVRRIFEAKGRPATNPIIVHARDWASAKSLGTAWPDAAHQLAQRFCPGPLTLVLPKQQVVPDIVTAGGVTVAVRVPAHPVALALLRSCDLPLAAPSANRSGELSPTTAEHVLRGLDGRIDMILDAGPCPGGIESTVLDVSVIPPCLLRPGPISRRQIEEIVGPIQLCGSSRGAEQPLRSPGQLERHYAPRTPLHCRTYDNPGLVEDLLAKGNRVGWLVRDEPGLKHPGLHVLILPEDPVGYSTGLYSALHRLDEAGLDCIVVDMPHETDEWLAVRDRLKRAAQG